MKAEESTGAKKAEEKAEEQPVKTNEDQITADEPKPQLK